MVKIAIKKINNKPYIDNDIERFGEKITDIVNECGYVLIELPDQYKDCISTDFNDDLSFNESKYNARKQHDINSKRIAEIDAELRSLDYIGVKIATGRATREEYAEKIARMNSLANERNRLINE